MDIRDKILIDNDIIDCYKYVVWQTPFDLKPLQDAANRLFNLSGFLDIAKYYHVNLSIIDFLYGIFYQRKTKKSMIHFQQWLVKNNFKSIIKYCHE